MAKMLPALHQQLATGHAWHQQLSRHRLLCWCTVGANNQGQPKPKAVRCTHQSARCPRSLRRDAAVCLHKRMTLIKIVTHPWQACTSLYDATSRTKVWRRNYQQHGSRGEALLWSGRERNAAVPHTCSRARFHPAEVPIHVASHSARPTRWIQLWPYISK